MFELSDVQTESAAGGFSLNTAWTIAKMILSGGQAFETGMSAVGGTLSNYYGTDMTLEIVAAGNMTA